MNKYTWEALEVFVRHEAGLSSTHHLAASTTIEDELGITGDDAIAFMTHFFETFPIQTGDFDFNRYFCEEGFNPFEIVLLFFSKNRRQKYIKVPLTLEMLYLAISDGKWNIERLESTDS